LWYYEGELLINELNQPDGYFTILGARLLIAGIGFLIFIRRGWFK
jgi:LPXTG-motif cell wall-anchored protein